MKKLSFKEYYESKQKLLSESDTVVVFKTKHDVYKYCKVPFTVDGERKYVSFKPKDTIMVEWQRTGNEIIPLVVEIGTASHNLAWNSKKMKSWVETSTTQLFE